MSLPKTKPVHAESLFVLSESPSFSMVIASPTKFDCYDVAR